MSEDQFKELIGRLDRIIELIEEKQAKEEVDFAANDSTLSSVARQVLEEFEPIDLTLRPISSGRNYPSDPFFEKWVSEQMDQWDRGFEKDNT